MLDVESGVALERELLTVEQVADYLQVHPETVRQWLRDGRMAGINFGRRGGWRVHRDDLTRFIDSLRQPHE